MFFLGLNSLIDVFYGGEELMVDCYDGVMEMRDVYKGYHIIQTNTSYLMWRAIFNAGLVYDNIVNISLYFMQDKRSKVLGPFDVGFRLGSIFYDILFPDVVTLAEELPDIYG